MLKDRVEKILELDKKRTQGDWRYSAGGYLAGCDDYDCSIIYLLDGKEIHKHPETGEDLIFEVAGTIILGEDGECLDKDIEFMSKAPEMVELIKDQQSRIDELEKALKTAKSGYELFVYRYPDPDLLHEEYRVKVCITSEEAIEDIDNALKPTKAALKE